MIGLIISYTIAIVYTATSESRFGGSIKGNRIMKGIMMFFYTCIWIEMALKGLSK